MKKAILKNKIKNVKMFGVQNLRLKLIYTLVILLVIAAFIFFLWHKGKSTDGVSEELIQESINADLGMQDKEVIEEETLQVSESKKEAEQNNITISKLFGDESLDEQFPEKCQIQIRDSKHDLTKLYAFRDEAQAELDLIQEEYDRALDNVKEAQEDIEKERENLGDIRDNCREKGSPW